MASRGLSREDVLRLVLEDDSDFSGSESSGEERNEVYSYRGTSFSAPSARLKPTVRIQTPVSLTSL